MAWRPRVATGVALRRSGGQQGGVPGAYRGSLDRPAAAQRSATDVIAILVAAAGGDQASQICVRGDSPVLVLESRRSNFLLSSYTHAGRIGIFCRGALLAGERVDTGSADQCFA